jgi:hypothetical protein
MNGYPRSFFTNVTYRFLLAPDFLSSLLFFLLNSCRYTVYLQPRIETETKRSLIRIRSFLTQIRNWRLNHPEKNINNKQTVNFNFVNCK